MARIGVSDKKKSPSIPPRRLLIKKGFRGLDQHGPLSGFGEAKKDVYAGDNEHKIVPLVRISLSGKPVFLYSKNLIFN
jgi:hypothetical protein